MSSNIEGFYSDKCNIEILPSKDMISDCNKTIGDMIMERI